jgi:hypothetical protein
MPPADPILADQTLDHIHESNCFIGSFGGILGDDELRPPHNNTASPKGTAPTSNCMTIEDLKECRPPIYLMIWLAKRARFMVSGFKISKQASRDCQRQNKYLQGHGMEERLA